MRPPVIRALDDLVDRAPRLKALASGDWGAMIRRRLELGLPEIAPRRREAILRGLLRHRAGTRLMYKLTVDFTPLAKLYTTFVPLAGAHFVREADAHAGAIIMAATHFGPPFTQLLVVQRLLPRRRFYVVHARDHFDNARTTRFLERIGCVSVKDDEQGLRFLARALRDDPRAVLTITFDRAQPGARRTLRFLSMSMAISSGIGYLADVGRCPVVPLIWEWTNYLPRMTFGEIVRVDQTLPPRERRERFTEDLYRRIERTVRRIPEQWIEWQMVNEPRPFAPETSESPAKT
jgi:lauroyl/myristoyl acyltransferase